jgi:hypothetical protein
LASWQLASWQDLDKPEEDWGGADGLGPEEAAACVEAILRLEFDVDALLNLLEPKKNPSEQKQLPRCIMVLGMPQALILWPSSRLETRL